jgi:hypothetical protein
MRKAFAAVRQAFDLRDIVFVFGLGLLAAGCFAVYWPLGLIVPGAILTGLGIYAARLPTRRPPETRREGE